MSKNKEVRVREKANRDPEITGFNYDEFFENRLALADNIKKNLTSKGLDWRFINAQQFRNEGGVHRSHWKPIKFDPSEIDGMGANAEGYIQRGDLILAVREKRITSAHKQFLAKRNRLQMDTNKEDARALKRQLKDAGVDPDESRVYEGYEEDKDEKGVRASYKAVEDEAD